MTASNPTMHNAFIIDADTEYKEIKELNEKGEEIGATYIGYLYKQLTHFTKK